MRLSHIVIAVTLAFPSAAPAETREEWVALGARIHGAFGPFIPVGIRIGLDAQQKLHAEPRGLTVTYYSGANAPCPCIADGVMIATHASPGQGTLQIAQEKAPDGLLALIVIKNRNTGESLRYSISDEWLPRMLAWLKTDPPARYDAAMAADDLFRVEASK